MFRRTPQTKINPGEAANLVRRYQIHLIPNYPLDISNGAEKRKHLALIGDPDWVNYWFLDILAQSQTTSLTSTIVTGPADSQLRLLPQALNLSDNQCAVNPSMPYSIDLSTFRQRIDHFTGKTSESAPSLILMGRDLTHVWPFMLGKKDRLQGKLAFIVADMTPNLKLPLSENCRYFLVQTTFSEKFQRALERWHRHYEIKPVVTENHLPDGKSILYEINDPEQ